MLTKFLIKKFIPNYKDKNNRDKRSQYGYLGGIVSVIINIILFIIKIILGFTINSISLIADSINNLSDVGSSAIILLGFKLSRKPADKEHPFGHGRTEYIAALIISLIIIMVGFELFQNSFKRVFNPLRISFNGISIIILIITIVVKLWLGLFNKSLSKIINSKSLAANAIDSFSDVFATSCVVLSIVLSPYTSLPIDAYMGIIVAIVIMFSGLSMAKDTLNSLLGKAPDPDLVKKIKETILDFDGIKGVHDLVIHDYGPNRTMATLHVEVSDQLNSIVAHDIIDAAERKIAKEFNIFMVIHIDPLRLECEIANKVHQKTKKILSTYPGFLSFHDFRIIQVDDKNSMIFEMVVKEKLTNQEILSLKEDIKTHLYGEFPSYDFFITMERQHTFFH